MNPLGSANMAETPEGAREAAELAHHQWAAKYYQLAYERLAAQREPLLTPDQRALQKFHLAEEKQVEQEWKRSAAEYFKLAGEKLTLEKRERRESEPRHLRAERSQEASGERSPFGELKAKAQAWYRHWQEQRTPRMRREWVSHGLPPDAPSMDDPQLGEYEARRKLELRVAALEREGNRGPLERFTRMIQGRSPSRREPVDRSPKDGDASRVKSDLWSMVSQMPERRARTGSVRQASSARDGGYEL